MIPGPVWKTLALFTWLALTLGIGKVWWSTAPELQRYYLSGRSHFLYERLVIPPLPRFRGSKPRPEQYTILAVPCSPSWCMITTANLAWNTPVEVVQTAPAATVRKELDEWVYGGSIWAAIWWPIALSGVLFVGLLGTGIYLDARSRKRVLRGVQIQGRTRVKPSGFAGWWKRGSDIQIAVKKPRADAIQGQL